MSEGSEAQLEVLTQENAFMKKYLSLRNKCEQFQQANEKLVNRIHHVKKLVKRYKRERRFLTKRLDEHNDNYREAQVPVMWEEDQMYNLLRPTPTFSPHTESPAAVKQKPAKKIKSHAKPADLSHDSSLSTEISPLQSHDRQSASIMSSLQPLFLAHGMKQAESHMSTPKTKKVKVEKGFTPPKKPTNAFLMFCDQYRQAIQEEYRREHRELIPHHELTKRLAMRWNSLASDDKKVYYDMFEIEKRQYELDMMKHKQPASSGLSGKSQATMQLESDSAVSSLIIKQEL